MTEINKAKEWAKGQLDQVAKAAEARKGAPGERAFTAAKADPAKAGKSPAELPDSEAPSQSDAAEPEEAARPETAAQPQAGKPEPGPQAPQPAPRPAYPIQPATAPKERQIVMAVEFGKIYARIDPSGNEIMRPLRADVTLFKKLGHFYSIYAGREKDPDNPGKWRDKMNSAITAAGYTHLNKVAGISLLTPAWVIVDGIRQHNPHVERDKQTRAIQSVTIHKMGIGFSPIGTMVVVDKTLFYNTYTYFIQSVQAKMKRKGKKPEGEEDAPLANPNCAIYGQADENPKTMTPPRDGRWAFFPTEPPLGLWVNYDDAAILDCMDEHTQRQRFGDRIAQRIVERNIMKDHPAIGIGQVYTKKTTAQGDTATVTIYGYRNELRPPQIAEILRQAERGDQTAPFEVQTGTVDTIDPEEEAEAMKEIREAGDEPERGEGGAE